VRRNRKECSLVSREHPRAIQAGATPAPWLDAYTVALVLLVSLDALAAGAAKPEPLLPASLWLDIAKTFIGALLGAGLAFASNIYIQARLRRDGHVKAGNVALSLLVAQLNDFLAVRKTLLGQREKALAQSPDCPPWLHFMPTAYVFYEAELDVNALAFLFDKQGADAMQKVLYVQNLHRTLRSLVSEHREVRVLIQQRTAELGFRLFDAMPLTALEEKIGPYLVGRTDSVAKTLLDMLEEDEPEYEAGFRMLRTELISKLGKRFINMGTSVPPAA